MDADIGQTDMFTSECHEMYLLLRNYEGPGAVYFF